MRNKKAQAYKRAYGYTHDYTACVATPFHEPLNRATCDSEFGFCQHQVFPLGIPEVSLNPQFHSMRRYI
jgi:hypothetical protein